MFSVCTIKKCICYRRQEGQFPLMLEKIRVALNVPFFVLVWFFLLQKRMRGLKLLHKQQNYFT